MSAKNVLGLIFSNSYDDYLSELTGVRNMASVPFAGRYRLVDFVLSNMVNSGITKVGVSVSSNYQSLMDHVGSGKAWDLSRKSGGLTLLPPFNLASEGGMYKNRLEALTAAMNYIGHAGNEYVLMADCNTVMNLDYGKIVDEHIASGADVTIACKYGKKPAIPRLMTFDIDGDRITAVKTGENAEGSVFYSLGIVVMKKMLLERLVASAPSHGYKEFSSDLLGKNVSSLYIRGHKVEEYAATIDSLQSYYDISMGLLCGEYKTLFDRDKPIYTKVRDDVPATYGVVADVKNSLIADGCIIRGKVENCVLFRGVYVAEGAVVKNSVIMQDSYISQGSKINCCVFDKNVTIKPNRELSGWTSYPLYIGKGITI